MRCGGRVYNFGGGSSSSSSSSSHTDNIDQRLLQESGAIGANASGNGSSSVSLSSTTNNTDSRSFTDSRSDSSINTVITNTLDGGAIKASFGLGDHAIDSVTDLATSALSGAHHTAELALNGALLSVRDTKDAFYDAAKIAQTAATSSAQMAASAYSNANSEIATAYEGARVGNKNMLIVSGMALAAMALAVYGSKK